MAANLSSRQKKICLRSKQHLKGAYISLFAGALFPIWTGILLALPKYRLHLPQDAFVFFIIFGLEFSILSGHAFSVFSLMPVIQKLFRWQEAPNETELATELSDKERHICRNSREKFFKSRWLCPLFLMVTVGGGIFLMKFRFSFQTVEILVLYIALVVCSSLGGWYLGIFRHSPILTKLFISKDGDKD